MAENVLVLKKKAVAAGMPKKDAMKASRSELEEFLSDSKPKKSPVKKASPAKKKAAKAAPAAKNATAKKTAGAGKKTAAKKTSTKKTSNATTTGNGGRHMIEGLDFTQTDGWSPRENSPVAAIFRALKKRKGDVDKTTDDLLPNAKDYVSMKKQDGTKRTKDEVRALLRYRVNRTKWEFATRTGQHEASENRIKYGTGAYAQRNAKQSRKSSTKKNAKTAKTTGKKRGRPKGSKNKKTSKK